MSDPRVVLQAHALRTRVSRAAFLHGAPGKAYDASAAGTKLVLVSSDDGLCSAVTDHAAEAPVTAAVEAAFRQAGLKFRLVIEPYAARRAVRYGDGWIPLAGRATQYGDVFDYVPKFREMLKEAGRDPATFPISLFGSTEDPDTLKRYRDLGIVRVVVSLPAAKDDVVLPILDKWAKLIDGL